jgi:uncharacterized protein (DUF2236 family)
VTPTAANLDRAVITEDMRWFGASWFPALFAGALFDQVALPQVAAGVADTGRIFNDSFNRALRSAAAEQLAYLGDDTDRQAEGERLLRLHRDVKGTGPDGTPYSALHPDAWNWIIVSTFLMHRGAFYAVTGRPPSDDADQAIWDYFRGQTSIIWHPDERFRLPEDFADLLAWYERIADEKCRPNDTLNRVVALARRPPRPPAVPALAAPAWMAVSPVAGRVLSILGFGIMHPRIRAHAGIAWGRREQFEFAALTMALRVAHGVLPERVTLTPLGRNRRQYETLVAKYRAIGLDSFTPPP